VEVVLVKAIILAAGQGTRLKKYTQDRPKGMLDFMGKTVIERQIKTYRSAGISDIIIVKGFAGEKIDYAGVKYCDNLDYATTNMVESLLKAKDEFDDDIIVSYADIVFDQKLLQALIQNENDYVVAIDDNWQEYWLHRYGQVDFDTESLEIDEEGSIVSIGTESPNLEEIDSRYIGLLKFSAKGMEKILEIIERDREEYLDKPWKQSGKTLSNAYMTDLLQALSDSGEKIKAHRFINGWIEFDTNEDYEKACEWAEDGTIKKFLHEALD